MCIRDRVRTGGFVDEIDEDDVTEPVSGRRVSAMKQTAQTAASEAHAELKKEIDVYKRQV